MRDKINKILSEYGLSIADVFAGKEKESIPTEAATERILAVLSEGNDLIKKSEKDLREKIAEEYCISREWSCDEEHLGTAKAIFVNKILALLEQCPAMTIEDCPWGKENVEFREILLRGMNRQLEGIEVEEECEWCSKGTKLLNEYEEGTDKFIRNLPCPKCSNNGKTTRPATLEDLPLARIIEGLMIISDPGNIELFESEELLEHIQQIAKSLLTTPSGGRLVR